VVNVGGDWFYEEHARSVPSLGLEDKGSPRHLLQQPPQQPAAEERNRILDLFKN
jgi:penicillin-binding protein 1A